MRLTLLLFASLRERAGLASLPLEVPEGARVADALAAAAKVVPALSALPPGVRAALNQEFTGLDAAVRDGDELALLPPVSGG
jgi:molybdopterin converting factor subunit 1